MDGSGESGTRVRRDPHWRVCLWAGREGCFINQQHQNVLMCRALLGGAPHPSRLRTQALAQSYRIGAPPQSIAHLRQDARAENLQFGGTSSSGLSQGRGFAGAWRLDGRQRCRSVRQGFRSPSDSSLPSLLSTAQTTRRQRHDEACSKPLLDTNNYPMQLALSPHVAHLQSLSARSPTALALAFVASSIVSALVASPEHSLLVAAVSWGLLWIYSSTRIGLSSGKDNVLRRRYSWTAGALLALAQVCEQAAHDPEGVWWTKVRPSSASRQ